MKYGCIGEHLSHSFSKTIHSYLGDYEYSLCEIAPSELSDFMKNADFSAINVTIPYKEAVLPYLHKIDSSALEIGAVNTVVNRDGKLYGYNTDFYGMKCLIEFLGLSLSGKRVAILGTGGTSKTATAVAKSMGACQIIRVSRSGKDDAVTYEELYSEHADTDIIINTTPSGMYPDIYSSILDLSRLKSLSGVVDVVYNPLSTSLVLSARELGIKAIGGLYMLVAQAVRASEIFFDKTYDKSVLGSVYNKILREKENIVLVGMPASGKSTVGAALARELSREFVDTDALIEEEEGKAVSDIFRDGGEALFREIESKTVKRVSKLSGAVIATGGGAVLRHENVRALRHNGRLYFIDRPLSSLYPTNSRPLANDTSKIEKLYGERYAIYTDIADAKIDASRDVTGVMKAITEDFFK